MKIIRREDRFELAQFCMDYHSGQWSRGYRLLCKLGPGGNWSGSFSEELRQGEVYQHLVNNYTEKV